MKKLLSLALALAMALSLAAPAGAQAADERLSAVTAKLKETLDLNTDMYTEFYGDLEENPLAPTWYLEWYRDGGTLSITATEEGKLLNYYLNDDFYSTASPYGSFTPSFPTGDRAAAKAAAQAFLDKALGEGETAVLEDDGTDRLGMTRYRFGGEILINGLSAGLSFSIGVRCEDNEVISFYRDDYNGILIGEFPEPEPTAAASQAQGALRETLSLRLEYVLPEDGDSLAVLRYLPTYGDEFYVDAATGDLVNRSELFRSVKNGEALFAPGAMAQDAATEESGADAGGGNYLSEVEKEGVAKLEGVLSKEDLDSKLRELEALGLDAYSLLSASYSVAREADPDTGETAVTASLQYGRQVGDATWRRSATVDGRTGELLSLYSSGWLPEDGPAHSVDAQAAQSTAEEFLSQMAPGQFEKTALYEGGGDLKETDRFHTFTYAQQENGYFFTGNAIYVGVDAVDGSISSYKKSFDDGITFASPDGIITAEAAVDAWLATYETSLCYVMVPAAIDHSVPDYQPLMDMGISYLYNAVLGYTLEREDSLLGIDAKTGAPVAPDWGEEETSLAYSDLAGHWAAHQIQRLAQYGVGYAGGTFQPGKALTQLDLIALLVSTEGYLYQPKEEAAADNLYSYAYSLGLLTAEERSDNTVLTRIQTIALIVDACGYGEIAQLEGIFRTSFADDGEIPAGYYGYAALAQGLGIVEGAPGALLMPNAGATRAQAAVILYNLMER